MPFHNIVNSLAAIPYDANDNFLFVAQGSIYPRTGDDLETTTGAYDIGSTTKRFNDVFVSGQLNYSGTSTYSGSWQEMARYTFSVNTASISIDVNSDNDKNYRIIHMIRGNTVTSITPSVFFNGLSSGADGVDGVGIYDSFQSPPNDKSLADDSDWIYLGEWYAWSDTSYNPIDILDIYCFGSVKHYTLVGNSGISKMTSTSVYTHKFNTGRIFVNTLTNIKIEYRGSSTTADNTGTVVIVYRTQ